MFLNEETHEELDSVLLTENGTSTEESKSIDELEIGNSSRRKEVKYLDKPYFKCFKFTTRDIVNNAIVCALYVAITYILFPISFGQFQVRVSEFLVLLCFFNPNYIVGLTLGCALTNIYSSVTGMPFDILIGTCATFLSCFCISISKQMLIATLFPCIFNALLVGVELTYIAGLASKGSELVFFWTNFGLVFLGEFIAVTIIGYILFMSLMKTKTRSSTIRIISAVRNLNFKF